MNRTLAKTLCKYALGFGLLAWVIHSNWRPASGAPGLADALRQPIQLWPLVLSAMVLTLGALITFIRWFVLVRAQDLPFTLTDAIRLGLAGYFFNTFLPGSIGGDLVKAVGIARGQRRRTVAVATVVIDRAVGLWGLVWVVAVLGGVFWWADDAVLRSNVGLRAVVRSAWIALGATIAAWVVLGILPERRAHRFAGRLGRIPKIGHSLAEGWRAVWSYRTRPRAIATALALSFVSHSAYVVSFYLAAAAFVDPIEPDRLPTLAEHFLVVPLGMAIQALFPAPGGVGGGEYGFGKLYKLLGRREALGVLASLAQRALTWALGAVGYVVYLRLKPSGAEPVAVDSSIAEPAVDVPP